ncbi:hypothetical protein D3C78_1912080 [compost metagenome]
MIDVRLEDFGADACDSADITLREFLGEIHHLTAEMEVLAGLAALEHGGIAA